MIQDGYIVLARQIVDSEIWQDKPAMWLKIWLFILLKVNHKDKDKFKRGSCLTKYKWIEDNTGATRAQIDHCIRWLKQAKQIATRKATRGMFITVLNYDKYQAQDNYKSDTKSDSPSDLKATQKRHRSDTINKNDKNEKNEKKKQPTELAGINELLGLFKKVNSATNFGNKTQRRACENIIKEKGQDDAMKIVEYALSVQGERYAPTITTPLQLWTKLSNLQIYYEKENNSSKTIRV